MPYTVKGKCVYKKEDNSKVGCTKGSVKKYLSALHANANESVEITEVNKLKGGKADKLTIKDIADKFKLPQNKIKAQLEKGKKIESEHTKDKEKATEIAMDHLSEFPDYYDRLEDMERKATIKWGRSIKENDFKPLIKNLLRENLEYKNIFKKLEQENKTTLPKILTGRVFYKTDFNFLNNLRSNNIKVDDISTNPSEIIDLTKLVATQNFLNINNLKDVQDVGYNTNAELIKYNGLYYIVDGHHRLAMEILKGNDTAKAFVKKIN